MTDSDSSALQLGGFRFTDQDSSATSVEDGDDTAQFGATQTNLRRIVQQYRDEIRLLQDENTRLRAREVEISSRGVSLQQHFAAIQSQVDGLKNTIRTELSKPVSEQDYFKLESISENQRDLIDTIKIGIFQQLGSLRTSRDSAVQRAAELSLEVDNLLSRNRSLQQELKDKEVALESETGSLKRQITQLETRAGLVAELSSKAQDLQEKLKSVHSDQERFIEMKLQVSAKANDLVRTELRLKEAEQETQRFKAEGECLNQKLDILKAEYYDMRLKYNQRILELEHEVRVSNEKLRMLNDVELEAEVFLSNVATAAVTDSDDAAVANAAGQLIAVPQSRRMQHTLAVTKRCLSLENQLCAMKHDQNLRDAKIERLQKSLEMARNALNDTNSPYKVVEETVEALQQENDMLRIQLEGARGESSVLREKVKKMASDIETLSRHRGEMLRIRELLSQLGARPLALPVAREQPKMVIASKPAATSEVQKKHDTAQQPAAFIPGAIEIF